MAHLQTDGAQVFALWHNKGTTSRPKRPRGLNHWAEHMVDLATGQASETPSIKSNQEQRRISLGR